MPGNSQRKGAVRKTGKGVGNTGRTAGSGGRVRRGLEGKGPTPKAEDRPYHKAYRKRGPAESGKSQGSGSGQQRRQVSARAKSAAGVGPEWVIGRNPVYEALQAGLPVRRAYLMEGVERDSRLGDILKLAAAQGVPLLQASRLELDRLTGGAVHQGGRSNFPSTSTSIRPSCWRTPSRRPTPRSSWHAMASRIRAIWGRSSARRPPSERLAWWCPSAVRPT